MKYNHKHSSGRNTAIIAVLLILMYQSINAQPGYRHPQPGNGPYPYTQSHRQDFNPWYRGSGPQPFISIGIHFDPLISWFSADSYETRSDGVVPGFNFGISHNKYFGPYSSFSSGINIINAGGRLVSSKTTDFELKDYNREIITIQPGEVIIYKISYISVPLGIKLQTNQLGYGAFFTDLGFDPKILIEGRADIPSLNIKGGNAFPELRKFNLSYHIMAGMEYPLGEINNVVVGIGFEKNFFDITRDNGNQPWDLVSHKMVSFRIGITF